MAAMIELEWGGGRFKKEKGSLTRDADLWRSDQPREGESNERSGGKCTWRGKRTRSDRLVELEVGLERQAVLE